MYVKEILPNFEEVISGLEHTKTQIDILTEKVQPVIKIADSGISISGQASLAFMNPHNTKIRMATLELSFSFNL